MARASTLMAAGTAASRLLGFVRAIVLAAAIGATVPAANAFANANTVPNNLYLLIAGGVLNAVLVPQVVKAMARPDGGAEYLDRLVTAAVTVFAVITAALVIAAPLVVTVIAHNYTGGQRALTIAFALWCLPQVFFYALYTLLGQVLNARGRFGAYMWAPVVNNVVSIAGIGVFVVAFRGISHTSCSVSWTPTEIGFLGGTSTLGVVAQALVLLVPLRRAGIRLRPRFGLRGMGFASAGRVAGWTFAGVLVGQVAFLAVTNVAASASAVHGHGHGCSSAGSPGYAAWGYAYLVFMLPHSLVTVSVVTALFTRMSRSALAGNVAAVREDVSGGLRSIAVATVLSSAGLLVLSRAAGVVLAGSQGQAVGRVIFAMALGLVPFSASYLLQRAFYAFEDARTPFLVQTVAVAVWTCGAVLSGLVLPDADKVVGVAASMAAGQACGASVGLVLLHRRLGGLDGFRVARTHARLLVAAVLAAVAGLVVRHPLGGLVERGHVGAALLAAVVGAVMAVVYTAVALALRVEEVRPLVRRLARR